METQDFLPENDQDLKLAKQLNSVLESGNDIATIQDSVIQSLLAFKNSEQEDINILKNNTSDIWRKIDEETKHASKAKITFLTTRKSRSNFRVWATAATVLVAAFLGIFWITNFNQPKLVAQSGSSIESITLSDGSAISLRPHSSLYEVSVTESKRLYKLEGEAFFVVAKDKNRPFSVQANTGTITVLGTQFNVSTWGNETLVYLEEGSVRLDSDNKSVILKPGEQAIVSEAEISEPTSADVNEYKDWLANTIVLNSTPLSKVAAELEHHFQITINLDQFGDNSELISGTIPLSNLTNTLNDLGVILGGTFREVNSNSFVFIPLN